MTLPPTGADAFKEIDRPIVVNDGPCGEIDESIAANDGLAAGVVGCSQRDDGVKRLMHGRFLGLNS